MKIVEENTENTESTVDNKQLVQKYECSKGNPLIIIRQEEKYYVTLGMYMLEEGFHTLEEAQHNAETITIDRILQIVNILTSK